MKELDELSEILEVTNSADVMHRLSHAHGRSPVPDSPPKPRIPTAFPAFSPALPKESRPMSDIQSLREQLEQADTTAMRRLLHELQVSETRPLPTPPAGDGPPAREGSQGGGEEPGIHHKILAFLLSKPASDMTLTLPRGTLGYTVMRAVRLSSTEAVQAAGVQVFLPNSKLQLQAAKLTILQEALSRPAARATRAPYSPPVKNTITTVLNIMNTERVCGDGVVPPGRTWELAPADSLLVSSACPWLCCSPHALIRERIDSSDTELVTVQATIVMRRVSQT